MISQRGMLVSGRNYVKRHLVHKGGTSHTQSFVPCNTYGKIRIWLIVLFSEFILMTQAQEASTNTQVESLLYHPSKGSKHNAPYTIKRGREFHITVCCWCYMSFSHLFPILTLQNCQMSHYVPTPNRAPQNVHLGCHFHAQILNMCLKRTGVADAVKSLLLPQCYSLYLYIDAAF